MLNMKYENRDYSMKIAQYLHHLSYFTNVYIIIENDDKLEQKDYVKLPEALRRLSLKIIYSYIMGAPGF